MNGTIETSAKQNSVRFNRIAYFGLLAVAVIFLFLKDWHNAFIMLGIGLIADPFDTSVKFNDRPLWQRVWLLVHLAVLYGLIIYTVFTKI